MTDKEFMRRWKPEPSDIAWTARMIECQTDGAIWLIPRNWSIWKIDKINRVWRCIHGPCEERTGRPVPFAKDLTCHQMVIICDILNYQAVHAPDAALAEEAVKHLFRMMTEQKEPLSQTVINEALYGTGKTTERPELN